jgi:nicotinate-nucleotide adenylyltransferase
MRVGICGGTFDPFHRGHLDPILAVREAMHWDRILYIPAFVQPFKQDQETAPGHHRFAMAVLATEPYDEMYVSPMELERGAVSYTIDTLRQLRDEYPGATLDWIIGDDNLENLHKWKEIDAICSLGNFVVLARGQSPILNPQSAIPSIREAMIFAHNPTVPVSSTEIRRRVQEGRSIDDLAGVRISRYIHHYGLYGKGQT